MTEIEMLAARVARLRERHAEMVATRRRMETAWEMQNKPFLDCVGVSALELAQTEELLRLAAVDSYTATGNKAVAPGVSIRVPEKLEYDAGEAFRWASSHGVAVALDVKAFEKVAKAVERGLLPFVKFSETPQAAIAVDLSRYYPAPVAPEKGEGRHELRD